MKFKGLEITEKTNYDVVHDPTRYFENQSKVHALIEGDFTHVACGRDLAPHWMSCNSTWSVEIPLEQAINETTCKICLNKLNKIKKHLNEPK